MKKLFLFLGALFALSSAQAGILLEPYVGYNSSLSGEVQVSTAQPKMDLKFSSVVTGARLAYTRLGFELGGDLSFQQFDLKTTWANSTDKADFKRNDAALYFAFRLPLFIKAYTKYIFHSKLEGGKARTSWPPNTKFKGASGVGLGISYTSLPLVSLNFEYNKISWKKVKFADQPEGELHKKADFSEFLLSLSIPFNF